MLLYNKIKWWYHQRIIVIDPQNQSSNWDKFYLRGVATWDLKKVWHIRTLNEFNWILKTSAVAMTLMDVERMIMIREIPGLTSSPTCKEWAIAWESHLTTWPLSSRLPSSARRSHSPTQRQKWRRSEGMKTIQISFDSEQLTPTLKWSAVVKPVAELATHSNSVRALAIIRRRMMILIRFSPSSQLPHTVKCKSAHRRRERKATPPAQVAV